jgi:hypothetical protein
MWRNQIEDQLFKFRLIEELDPEMYRRLTDDNYYGKPLQDGDDPSKVKKYDQKERKKEILDFEHRAELISLMEDLGQKETVQKNSEP